MTATFEQILNRFSAQRKENPLDTSFPPRSNFHIGFERLEDTLNLTARTVADLTRERRFCNLPDFKEPLYKEIDLLETHVVNSAYFPDITWRAIASLRNCADYVDHAGGHNFGRNTQLIAAEIENVKSTYLPYFEGAKKPVESYKLEDAICLSHISEKRAESITEDVPNHKLPELPAKDVVLTKENLLSASNYLYAVSSSHAPVNVLERKLQAGILKLPQYIESAEGINSLLKLITVCKGSLSIVARQLDLAERLKFTVNSHEDICRAESRLGILTARPRWMVSKDLPRVLDIEYQSSEFPWFEEDFIKCLKDKRHVGIVAERGDEILGYMIYELHKTRLHAVKLAVDPKYRNKGVASQMIDHLVQKLSSQRHTEITFDMRETNLAAQIFLRENKFKALETLRGHFEDSGEDAYLMSYNYFSEAA